MTAALIEFMTGDERRETAARSPRPATTRRRLRRKTAEGETGGATNAARTEKETAKAEGMDT